MVQDIRTEKVLEELDMTSAQSESALWSILGFYFSIIFGLLAVLILLKTVKIGRFLDFSSSSDESVDAVEPASQSQIAANSPAEGKKTKESKYAQPPKSLNGSITANDATKAAAKAKKTTTPARKAVSLTTASSTTLSPVRVGTASANPIVSKTPASSKNKRKPEAPSTGRKKARKDPDAPKRPLSAYLMFQNEKRAELIRQNPNLSSTEITLLASHMWKEELTDAQKKPYYERNVVLSELYKKESTAYQAKKASEPMEVDETEEGAIVEKKGEKSPRRPKDPNAPKRPRTAFLVYNSNVEIRKALKEEFPDASPRDLLRMLGEKWMTLKPEEKERFEEVAKQEQTIYKIEKETYTKKKKAAQVKKAEPSNVTSLPQAEASNIPSDLEEPQTDERLMGFLGSAGVGGYVSSLFGMGASSGDATAKAKQTPSKAAPNSKKITSVKKTPVAKAKVSPVKKRTPVAKVPILSAARALRSSKRKTRSKTP